MKQLAFAAILLGLAGVATFLCQGQGCYFVRPQASDTSGQGTDTSGQGTDNSGGSGTSNQTSGINSAEPAGEPVPEIGEPVSLIIINQSSIEAGVRIRFLVGDVEVRHTELRVPAGTTMDIIGPDLATRVEADGQYVTGDPTPVAAWVLGTDFKASDLLRYILRGPGKTITDCPDDPNKTDPGICGCGVPDTDSDGDGTPDCIDGCPNDPKKTTPGACGCGVADTDSDKDGTPDCIDGCPNDPKKFTPGACGCGVADTDNDGDGTPDCIDGCPNDPKKTTPGACGCGVADADLNGNGTPDCKEVVPPPPPPATGACCKNDATCVDASEADCLAQGGNYQGQNTSCGSTTCCLYPFVDADHDGDVDQDDFGAFQLCYTGTGGGVPTGCGCFDQDNDGDVDDLDFTAFSNAWTGPNVSWSSALNQNGMP